MALSKTNFFYQSFYRFCKKTLLLKPDSNSKGFSLIELLVTSTITLGIFAAIISFLTNTQHQTANISEESVINKNVMYIAQTILSQSKNYQFYPSASDPENPSGFAGLTATDTSIQDTEKAPVYNILAFAINLKGDIIKVDQCLNCPKRLGVSIPPYKRGGLFKVWVAGIEKSSEDSYTQFLDLKMVSPLN
ncbi:MAG: PilW family protein [Bdellovibrionales bacterium]